MSKTTSQLMVCPHGSTCPMIGQPPKWRRTTDHRILMAVGAVFTAGLSLVLLPFIPKRPHCGRCKVRLAT